MYDNSSVERMEDNAVATKGTIIVTSLLQYHIVSRLKLIKKLKLM